MEQYHPIIYPPLLAKWGISEIIAFRLSTVLRFHHTLCPCNYILTHWNIFTKLQTNNTAYWSTIGSIYFSIKIVSPVRIFGNLGCFSTLITVPTCKVISVHMSFEHCKGLVPGLYVDILKVFCTAGSQCNSLFLMTADCCSKEKVFSPVFWQIFQLFEHFKPNFEIILVPP